jgi:hypothetical protein
MVVGSITCNAGSGFLTKDRINQSKLIQYRKNQPKLIQYREKKSKTYSISVKDAACNGIPIIQYQ